MNKLARLAITVGSFISAITSAHADLYTIGQTVNVKEVGVNPEEIVAINSSTLGNQTVYAGITLLTIDGVATKSFCIDPYQWSSSSTQTYTITNLANAPDTQQMGSSAAATVSKLWAAYYQDALTNAVTAAGLQIAIWETVAGNNFSVIGNNYGFQTMIDSVTLTNGQYYNITPANLIGVSSRTYQDYVGQNVPDAGTTLVLLGLGLVAMAVVGRKARSVATTTN